MLARAQLLFTRFHNYSLIGLFLLASLLPSPGFFPPLGGLFGFGAAGTFARGLLLGAGFFARANASLLASLGYAEAVDPMIAI